MKTIYKYGFIILLTVAFSAPGFFLSGFSDFGQMVSVAEASHKDSHKAKPPKPCKGKKCSPPPTVSELPIKYMIPVGMTMIMMTVGIVFLTQKPHRKDSKIL
jgi:hypothetical protein